MLRYLIIGIFLFVSQINPADAQEPVRAELFVEQETIHPEQNFWVALHLQLDDNWHIYWKNPGEAGMAPEIEWQLPEGYKIKNILWMTPEKYTNNGLITYGYQNEAGLLAEIIPSKTLLGNHNITAKITWVVCDENSCLPGESEVSARFAASVFFPGSLGTSHQALFEKIRASIPERHEQSSLKKKDGHVGLNISTNGELIEADFYPDDLERIDHRAEIAFVNTNSKAFNYDIFLKEKENGEKDKPLKGVVVLKSKQNDEITTKSYEINLAGAQKDNPAQESIFMALILAFAGGFLLNLMPCVLPVVSFKILSFVKMAGQQKSVTFKHAIAFSMGVLISFWALAGFLLSLQAYGHTVGWGFQLQQPFFVALLASIILMFALSLFGVFELGTGLASLAGQAQVKNPSSEYRSSFFSGVLATAVATPCTGPFLGTAVGFAFTLPPFQAMLIFTALALGMTSPYLVLGAFPQWLKFLPKPGNWMVIFKEIMGFLMMGTVLWLVWVFGAQTDNLAVFLLLIGFFFLSIAGWIYGKWGTPVKKQTTRKISYFLTAIFLMLGGYMSLFASQFSRGTEETIADSWEKFDPARLAALKEAGIPVFVDFTAKWCLICQTNHLVLASDAVSKKFEDLGVVKMKADLTKNDPEIVKELKKYGRSSVPLYLFHPGGNEEAIILPQVLNQNIVMEKISANDL